MNGSQSFLHADCTELCSVRWFQMHGARIEMVEVELICLSMTWGFLLYVCFFLYMHPISVLNLGSYSRLRMRFAIATCGMFVVILW